VKPRDVTCALAAFAVFAVFALGLGASGCDDGDSIGVPVTRAVPPFGTEPSPVSGSEPTTGGNDPPSQPETSIPSLCSAFCTRLQSECPGATPPDCVSSCISTGLTFSTCTLQFRAVLTCSAMTPLACYGIAVQPPGCEEAQAAFSNCINR
jgi:hypothetical protein